MQSQSPEYGPVQGLSRFSLLGALLSLFLVAGCGQAAKPKRVPDVRGQRLDLAEDRLEARGLDWEEIGGGNLGIIVRSHWYVCTQEPAPGKQATRVRLVAERSCPTPVVRPSVIP